MPGTCESQSRKHTLRDANLLSYASCSFALLTGRHHGSHSSPLLLLWLSAFSAFQGKSLYRAGFYRRSKTYSQATILRICFVLFLFAVLRCQLVQIQPIGITNLQSLQLGYFSYNRGNLALLGLPTDTNDLIGGCTRYPSGLLNPRETMAGGFHLSSMGFSSIFGLVLLLCANKGYSRLVYQAVGAGFVLLSFCFQGMAFLAIKPFCDSNRFDNRYRLGELYQDDCSLGVTGIYTLFSMLGCLVTAYCCLLLSRQAPQTRTQQKGPNETELRPTLEVNMGVDGEQISRDSNTDDGASFFRDSLGVEESSPRDGSGPRNDMEESRTIEPTAVADQEVPSDGLGMVSLSQEASNYRATPSNERIALATNPAEPQSAAWILPVLSVSAATRPKLTKHGRVPASERVISNPDSFRFV